MTDLSHNPVSRVLWVPIDRVYANEYNPNSVAATELQLLYLSIRNDGYTMPIVTVKSDGYKLALPCGIISFSEEKDKNTALWNFSKNRVARSSPTLPARWTATAASTSIDKEIAIRFISSNPRKTAERIGVDGSANNGSSEMFTESAKLADPVSVDLAQALCGVGTSRGSINANLYYIAFCPFCISESPKPWKHWNTFVVEPEASTKAPGMILKCSSSKIIGSQYPTEKSPPASIAASMQLGQGESASDLFAAHNDAKFVIVDGFHRYTIMKRYPDIYAKNHGLLPVVVIDKPLNDRMASTVRHNRARGKHSIQGMGNLVMQMLSNGWRDSRICGELGLEKEELARLKHITGYAKMFKDAQYSRARETPRQIEVRLKGEA